MEVGKGESQIYKEKKVESNRGMTPNVAAKKGPNSQKTNPMREGLWFWGGSLAIVMRGSGGGVLLLMSHSLLEKKNCVIVGKPGMEKKGG